MKIENFYEKHSETHKFRKSIKAGFISYLRVENDQAELDESVLIKKYKEFTGVDPTTGEPAEIEIHKNPTPEKPSEEKKGKGKKGKGKNGKGSETDSEDQEEDQNPEEPDGEEVIEESDLTDEEIENLQ